MDIEHGVFETTSCEYDENLSFFLSDTFSRCNVSFDVSYLEKARKNQSLRLLNFDNQVYFAVYDDFATKLIDAIFLLSLTKNISRIRNQINNAIKSNELDLCKFRVIEKHQLFDHIPKDVFEKGKFLGKENCDYDIDVFVCYGYIFIIYSVLNEELSE